MCRCTERERERKSESKKEKERERRGDNKPSKFSSCYERGETFWIAFLELLPLEKVIGDQIAHLPIGKLLTS